MEIRGVILGWRYRRSIKMIDISLGVIRVYKQPWKQFYAAYIQSLLAALSRSYNLQQSERF